MKAALIQTKQNRLYDFLNEKLRFPREEDLALQREMLEQTLELAWSVPPGCDLIVTSEAINYCGPERALEGEYASWLPEYPQDGLWERLQALAAGKKAWLVAGVYNRRIDSESVVKCYNSALVYDRDGRLAAVYDKIHLTEEESRELTPGLYGKKRKTVKKKRIAGS